MMSTEAPIATESSWFIVDHLQTLIETVHVTTGLPWWATIAGSALSIRVALFPLVVYQTKAQHRFGQCVPEAMGILTEFRRARAFIPKKDRFQHLKALLLLKKGVKLLWQKYDCHPVKALASPLVQVPAFVTLSYTIRDMILKGTPGMDTGGLWWFTDLTIADPSYVLPVIAATSTYFNLEFLMRSPGEGGFANRARPILQFLPILGFPLFMELPQGVFVYWITSSCLTWTQYMALKIPVVRRVCGLPKKTEGQSVKSVIPSNKLIKHY